MNELGPTVQEIADTILDLEFAQEVIAADYGEPVIHFTALAEDRWASCPITRALLLEAVLPIGDMAARNLKAALQTLEAAA